MFRKKNNVIFFDSLKNKHVESSEVFNFFLYLQGLGYKNIYYVTIQDSILSKNIPGVIKYNKSLFSFFTWVIWSCSTSLFSFTIKDGRLKGIPNKIFVQHGIIYEQLTMQKLVKHRHIDKIVISGQVELGFLKHLNVPNEKIIQSGLLRYQNLQNNTKNFIFIYLHWKSCKTKNYNELLSSILDVIDPIIKNTSYKIKVGLHHNLYRFNNINFSNIDVVDSLEISKYVRESCCLITDYSSLFNDFFFLQKPVIFYNYNSRTNHFMANQQNTAKSIQELQELFKAHMQRGFILDEQTRNKFQKYVTNFCHSPYQQLLNNIKSYLYK